MFHFESISCISTQKGQLFILLLIVEELKSRIVQKHIFFFTPERYTAGILYTDSRDSAWYETTV